MIPCKCNITDCRAGLVISDDPPVILVRDAYGDRVVSIYLDQTNISDLMLELRSLVNTIANRRDDAQV